MTLKDYFNRNNRIAIAFSGGVDSAYLLHEAVACCEAVTAYYVRTAFQPEFEYQDALRLAEEMGADLRVLESDVLANPDIIENTSERCYYCKNNIMRTIIAAASADGYSLLADGTNASDLRDDRPGMRALDELRIVSPLRECSLTKDEIRQLSRDAGLWTWDKPAYACLATRIPTGMMITSDKLGIVEKAEDYLMGEGLRDFRVRVTDEGARLELNHNDTELFENRRDVMLKELGKDFTKVEVVLGAR